MWCQLSWGNVTTQTGMCGDLLAQILILLQTPFVHLLVKQICDRRQLIKIGALSKVIYGLFL